MSQITKYADNTPLNQFQLEKELLDRAYDDQEFLIDMFGKKASIRPNNTKQISWRRYAIKGPTYSSSFTPNEYWTSNLFDPDTRELTEGVTPEAQTMQGFDVNTELKEFAGLIQMSENALSYSMDDLMSEAMDQLGEQAARTVENYRFNVLKAGTNVYRTNGTARNQINTIIADGNQLKLISRFLRRQHGKFIKEITRSDRRYGTQNIRQAYIGMCHPDVRADLEAVSGFTPAKDYGGGSENLIHPTAEFGSYDRIRFLESTVMAPWLGAGASGGTDVEETGGLANVYPVIIFARDAFGLVRFEGGNNSVKPYMLMPKSTPSDPLAQRAQAGFRLKTAALILNDFHIARLECAVSDLS